MESTRVVQRPRVLPTSSTPSHVVETQNTPSGTLKRKNTGNASKPRKRKGRAPHGAKKIQQSTSELSPSEARFSQAPTSITNGTEKGLDGKTMTNGSATHARESKGVRAKLKKLNKRAQSWGVFAPGLVTSYTKETMMQPMKGRSGTVADRDKATQECLEELQSLHEQTSRLDLQGNNSLQKTVKMVTHNAEVDYQYCLLYPSDKPFRLPPGPRPPALTQTPKSTRATRQNFWDLVEKSLSGGTLDQLKQQDDFKSTFRSPEVGPSGAASTQEHGSVNNDEVFELLDHITISSTGEDEDKEDDANVREDVIINMQKSPDGDPATERPETSEAAADPAVPLQDVDVNQIERPQAMRAKSESEVEEGETRDSDENPDPGDAMMDYSNSNGFTGKPDEPRSDPEHSSQNFRTLRELGPQELNLQLRYFHLGKNPTEVDMNAAPKCLHCGQGTHDSSICDSLECDKCGKREDHLTEFCPTTTKCPKCREKGHIEKDCPYKLITLAPEEIVCSICQHKNHVEEDCELTWRTSGKPWEFDFSTYSLSVSCYECGVTGHLGNDCPTRRPGKSLGSSTWTKHQRFSVPAQLEKSTRPLTTTASSNKRGELKIKGRAKNHPHNRPSIYNETEKSDFLRPKNVPQPKRSGQIQIGPVQNPMFGYEPSVDRNPVQPQSRNYSTDWRESVGRQPERREYYRDRYDDRSYDRALVDSRWAESRARRRSRSLSPPAMDRRRGRLDDYPSYHRDSRAGGELYRPMPSAAQSDYCDVYLTHDSMSVRKAHNAGRNHERNVLDYYQQIGHEKAQSVIDSITSSYAAEGQASANPMLAPPPSLQGGIPPPLPGGGPGGFPPPPFSFPGGMPPPFPLPGAQGGPGQGLGGSNPPPGFPPLPLGRGMPPFPPPPFPQSGSPAGNAPPIPGMPGAPPFMPPGGFPGFPPPGGNQASPPPPPGGQFGPPGTGGGDGN